jgi:hypothetical protein
MNLEFVTQPNGEVYAVLQHHRAYINFDLSARIDDTKIYPTITVSYTFEELSLVAPIFERLKKEDILPEVYICDLREEELELVILFRVRRPSMHLLEYVVTRTKDVTGNFYDVFDCEQFVASSQAYVPRNRMSEFLEICSDADMAYVLIGELALDDSDEREIIEGFPLGTVKILNPSSFN